MSEFRLMMKPETLTHIVEHYLSLKTPMPEEIAAIDVHLDLYYGKLKKYRDYAKRWGWKQGTTYDRLKRILEEEEKWMFANNPSKIQARSKQDPSKWPENQHDLSDHPSKIQARSKQDPSKTDCTILEKVNYNLNPKEKPLRGKKKSFEDRNQIVMDSWNDFASRHQLPTIRSLSRKRMRWIELRYDEIWPEIESIYSGILREPHLMGDNDRGWKVNFDYLWRDDTNYLKILEGGHWPRSKQRGYNEKSDIRGNSGSVQDTAGSSSRSLQRGVHSSKARDFIHDSRQKKRQHRKSGESFEEHLRSSGYSDDEIREIIFSSNGYESSGKFSGQNGSFR